MAASKKSIDRLIEALDHKDADKRRNAAQELSQADERAIYPLIKALRDENSGVQDAAMRSLIAIGGETVAYMVAPLLRGDSFQRNTAQIILRDLGSAAVPILYPQLKDKDDDVRKFALDLMGDIREGVDAEQIIPMMKDPNANVRASAIRALGLIEYRDGLQYFINALKDEEWVCFTALEALAQMNMSEALDPIMELLESDSETIRQNAVDTLGSIGTDLAKEALLRHIRKARPGGERVETIRSLVRIGVTPSMSEVYDQLMSMLQGDDWDDRLIALKGLVDLKDVNAVPIIIDIAGGLDASLPGDEERLMAIKSALRELGPTDAYTQVLGNPEIKFKGRVIAAELAGETGSVSSVPVLVKLIGSDIRDVRRAAAMALGKLGTPEAVRALMRAVEDPESNVRKMAVICLGEVKAGDAFELLLGHLKSEKYDDIKEDAIRSLIRIDAHRLGTMLDGFSPELREAVARFSDDFDTLDRLSRDKERRVALTALSSFGSLRTQRAAERLLEAVDNKDAEIRRTAVMALGGIEIGHEKIKPLLKDSDMWVRLHAVRTLGQSLKQDMVMALTPMIHDKDIPVVMAAVEAISQIGGRDAEAALRGIESHENEAVRNAVRRALEKF